MSNVSIPATAEGMPKISKAEVIRLAWAKYREIHARYEKWQIERGIIDGSFSHALKTAWRILKEEAAAVGRKAAEFANPFAERIAGLRAQIDYLTYKPFGHHIAAERAALQCQINDLQRRAA
jgi:hypothetical protein